MLFDSIGVRSPVFKFEEYRNRNNSRRIGTSGIAALQFKAGVGSPDNLGE